MEVVVTADLDKARALVAADYCPIECSFGDVSLVDELEMDHHGALADKEPVSLRAWRDHHGARAQDPRFVVAGDLDADAAFAIAALAGVVPAPGAPDADRAGQLAALIARMDVDPLGVDAASEPVFGYRSMWADLFTSHTSQDPVAAVLAWGSLCRADERRAAPYRDAATQVLQRRHDQADEQYERCRIATDDARVLVLDGVDVWGFDRWYGRLPAGDPADPAAWRHPVVVTRGSTALITVGCPNVQVAESLFGAGGLLQVFALLQPPGWGGRESIGGSPRGQPMGTGQLREAAEQLIAMLPAAESVRAG